MSISPAAEHQALHPALIELRSIPRHVVWKKEIRNGKETKIPYDPKNCRMASVDVPSTWASYEIAFERQQRSGFDGVGFVLTEEDELVGIDLDKCIACDGTIEPWALEIVQSINSYTEISPSGTGIRIFIKGKLPAAGRRKGRIEVYESGRYLTVTGNHLEGTPTAIESRQAELDAFHSRIFPPAPPADNSPRQACTTDLQDSEIITKAGEAANGTKFRALWAGDFKAWAPSWSEADLSLCMMLAFWTGRDPARMDVLFRASGLMRNKWDSRRAASTYGKQTIEKACAMQSEVYQPAQKPEDVPWPEESAGYQQTSAEPEPEPVDDYEQREREAIKSEAEPAPEQPKQEQGKKPRFEFLTAADALQPIPEIAWQIDGLVSAGSVNVFAGPPGSKKTYALIDASICLATGEPWLGRAIKPCRVLIVDEESGRNRLLRRLGDCLRWHNAGPDTPLFSLVMAGVNLRNHTGLELLEAAVKECGAQFVLIDALADIMAGGDENMVRDVQPVFLAIRRIVEASGSSVNLIHHTGKDGNYRGSSAIKGACDSMILVESEAKSTEIRFSFEKSRDTIGEAFAAEAFFEDRSFHLEGRWIDPKSGKLKPAEQFVIEYLEKHGESPRGTIISAADRCSENSARLAIYALANRGMIRRTNPGDKEARYQRVIAI